jgi:hypothetical protein
LVWEWQVWEQLVFNRVFNDSSSTPAVTAFHLTPSVVAVVVAVVIIHEPTSLVGPEMIFLRHGCLLVFSILLQ